MKRFTKNFKRLSAKQIRTYAAVIILATLSFNAMASASDEQVNYDPVMLSNYEANLNEELVLENWMTSPFETGTEVEASAGTLEAFPSETVLDEELTIENWMTSPFETVHDEVNSLESSMCAPMP